MACSCYNVLSSDRRFTMKSDPKFNGRYVQGAGGTRLFVEEIGDRARPSILWLHGYCQCRLSWDKQFESDLTKQFHLVRMDIRGHGLSDKLSDPEAFTDGKNWADDIHAVITALQLKKPVMCGWSYGGSAIGGAITPHPARPRGGGLLRGATCKKCGARTWGIDRRK